MTLTAKKSVRVVWIGLLFFSLFSQTPFIVNGVNFMPRVHSESQQVGEAPVPIIYSLNESHGKDWVQCASNGLIGISYYNKQNSTLYYKTIEPNGNTSEQPVTQGTHLEVSVLLYDSELNPHIFVATSGNNDQIITHYTPNSNAQWVGEEIVHFNNEGGKHIYELSAELGPNDTFHLLVLKIRSNPDSDDYYWAFLGSNLYLIDNVEGNWQKYLIKSYNTIPTMDEYVKALNRQDLKIDKEGFVHIVYGEVPTNSFGPSRLCYTTNKTGSWITEIALNITQGSMDDGGLFPSLCLNSLNVPSISCTYVDRVPTGSATQAKLLFLTRTGFEQWISETVATTDDSYSGHDGNGYTGGLSHLVFDSNDVPHIAFTDIASTHAGLQYWNLGNIRYAKKSGGEWILSTVYRQNPPISNYNATEINGLCLLVSDQTVQVVGVELKLSSGTNYTSELIHKIIESHPTNSQALSNGMGLVNYPNPFSSKTIISFSLQSTSQVRVSVYNFAGEELSILINQMLPTGTHTVEFISKGLASGVYFYKLVTPDHEQIAKMILIK